jgi:hypothetical protein
MADNSLDIVEEKGIHGLCKNISITESSHGGSNAFSSRSSSIADTGASSNSSLEVNSIHEKGTQEMDQKPARESTERDRLKTTFEFPLVDTNAVSECNLSTKAKATCTSAAAASAGKVSGGISTSASVIPNANASSRNSPVRVINSVPILPIAYTPKANNISTVNGDGNTCTPRTAVASPKIDLEAILSLTPAIATPRTPAFLAAPSPQPKSWLHFAPTQLISEEIEQTGGMIFQNYDEMPKEQFLHAPGVRICTRTRSRTRKSNRIPAHTQKKNRKRRRNASSATVGDNNNTNDNHSTQAQEQAKAKAESEKVQYYTARTSYAGVSVNLGSDHLSSTPAAAALDIANKLWWGAENTKPLFVLSESEVTKALETIGYGVHVHPDEFMHSLFTQDQKDYFESLVERALASLGGRDDYFADILCGIDKEGDRDRKRSIPVLKYEHLHLHHHEHVHVRRHEHLQVQRMQLIRRDERRRLAIWWRWTSVEYHQHR